LPTKRGAFERLRRVGRDEARVRKDWLEGLPERAKIRPIGADAVQENDEAVAQRGFAPLADSLA
jgi:hypothetical protein